MIDLLGDSAWPAMPPAPHAYQGPAAIAAFLEASARWRDGRRFRLVPTRANGQPAFGYYLPIQRGRGAEPIGIVVLSVRGHRIAAVTRLLDPELPRAFGVATPAD